LKEWFDTLNALQSRDIDPERIEWKSYGPGLHGPERRKAEGGVALGVVAAAMTALTAEAPASVEVFRWAWRAAARLNGYNSDPPSDLEAVYNDFESKTNTWTSGHVITAIFNGLSGRVVPSPENERVILPLSQAEHLVKWFSDQRIDVSRSHRWTALVVVVTGGNKQGECAALNLEAVSRGRGEIYVDPVSFAFGYRDRKFNDSLSNAKDAMKNLGWWDCNSGIRWFLTIPGTNRLPPLEGGSLGGLFAAGLWHLLSGGPRDIDVTVCAQIDTNGNLTPVLEDDIDLKLEAAQKKGVAQVVVAANQKWKKEYSANFVVKADAFANLETHTKEGIQARMAAASR
jgi:hypothetical protein